MTLTDKDTNPILTDVNLTDKDINSILAVNASRTLQGNMTMKGTQPSNESDTIHEILESSNT